jgi:hypothetical protein
MTSYNTKLAVSLSEIEKQVKEGNTKDALESLDRLWKVVCRIGSNEEVLNCSYLHTKEVLKDAERENKIIKSSIQYLHEIVLGYE